MQRRRPKFCRCYTPTACKITPGSTPKASITTGRDPAIATSHSVATDMVHPVTAMTPRTCRPTPACKASRNLLGYTPCRLSAPFTQKITAVLDACSATTDATIS